MEFLNGKKTWIGLVLFGVGTAMQAVAPALPQQEALLKTLGGWFVTIGGSVTAVGGTHKLIKGQ